MKRIKGITYVVLVFSLSLVGCGQQDAKDAERLSQIEEMVGELYHVEMNDLAEDLSAEQFEEVEGVLEAEEKEALNEENSTRLLEIESFYQNAWTMYELEEAVDQLFMEDTDRIIKEGINDQEVEEFFTSLSDIDEEKWANYYQRLDEKLVRAEEQVKQIKEAKKLVADLYLADGEVYPEASHETVEKAKEVTNEVENEAVRSDLEHKLEEVDQYLIEKEEKAEKAEKAARSIGNFAGYYFDAEYNYLITITEDSYEGFIPNSGSMFDYEIVKINYNSGDKINLILHHEAVDEGGHSIPETTTEVTWELIDGGAFIKGNSSIIRRISPEEYNEKAKGLF